MCSSYNDRCSVVVLEESPCPRGSSKTNLQVLVFVFVPQTKSWKIVKDFAFCKQSVMYDHVVHKFGCRQWSSVIIATVKNGLLTDIIYCLYSVGVLVLEEQFASPCPLSLSSDLSPWQHNWIDVLTQC